MNVDEYNLFLNQINTLVTRRQAVTATYLSVNTVLIGAMAFLFKDGQLTNLSSQISALTLLLSGVVVCSLWRRLIVQHSTQINWWYAQLRELEAETVGSKKLITKEYEDLYAEKKGRAAIGLTRYETQLTWLFTIIYLVFGLVIGVILIIHLF